MSVIRLISAYRWPIFLGGLLAMPIVACAVLVWVATRPDSPRPIEDYYEAARTWDADEAVQSASRALGWTVHYQLPTDIPHIAGMPRPIDITVSDRAGNPVCGLEGRLFALRPADTRLNQSGEIVPLPQAPGVYRTLVRLDAPGTWELRLDAQQQSMRFVHAARMDVPHEVVEGSTR